MAVGKITYPIIGRLKSLYNGIPSVTVAKNSVINSVEHIGRKWTSPQQRLLLGATAIFMQPGIDARNKNVDEPTKKASVAKTISKIVVGTFTGVIIRHLSIKAVKAMSVPLDAIPQNIKPIVKKFKTLLSPEKLTSSMTDELTHYRNAMGTFISLFIMLFTNFGIDAPWTNKLTNFLMENEKCSNFLDKFVKKRSKVKGGTE